MQLRLTFFVSMGDPLGAVTLSLAGSYDKDKGQSVWSHQYTNLSRREVPFSIDVTLISLDKGRGKLNTEDPTDPHAHLLYHLHDEQLEGGLGHSVPSVLPDVASSHGVDMGVLITQTLDLHVEGRLQHSLQQVQGLSNTSPTPSTVRTKLIVRGGMLFE